MRCSKTLALAFLLTCCGAIACGKELETVVVEGEIAPELDLRGAIFFRTFRGLFFCKRNLLQAPNPRDKEIKASFVRKGNRYTLTYDSSDAPRGGICDWRPDDIVVELNLRDRHTSDIFILNLYPIGATNRYLKSRPRVEKTTQIVCDIEYGVRARPRCDWLERVLDDRSSEVHVTLNVRYEKGHKPVHQ